MSEQTLHDRIYQHLERYRNHEIILDAFWQWASNPTLPSAGHVLKENCGFIQTNLDIRYGAIRADDVARVISEQCELLQENNSVFETRQAIFSVLGGEIGDALRASVTERLNSKHRILATWLVARAYWNYKVPKWTAGEYDWSLGLDLQASGTDLRSDVARTFFGDDVTKLDLTREAIEAGVTNRMFYQNVFGRMEPKLRPGPRILTADIRY